MSVRALLGTACALVAFAGNSLLCRAAIQGGRIDPASFTAIRLAAGALMLAALARGRIARIPPGRASFRSAALLAVYAIAFAFAYAGMGAGTGALILFGSVQLTMLALAWRAGERPHAREWAGIVLALAGLTWLVAPGLHAPPAGSAALMALAGASWGVYSLHGRGATDAVAETAANFARAVPFGLLALVVPAASGGGLHASAGGAGLALVSGALASGLAYAIWYRVLPKLTATRASAVQLAAPALAALGGVVLLGEPLSARIVVAAALILGGIGLTLARRRAKEAGR